MSRARRQAGFTLVEVMIALAILAMGLVSLLVFTANNLRQTSMVADEQVAVDLARGKIYDLEEETLADGFQELDQTREGDFAEEGRPRFRWEATIVPIRLPEDPSAMLRLFSGAADPNAPVDPNDPAATAAAATTTAATEPEDDGGLSAGFSTFYPILKGAFEEGIRKITLKVMWQTAGQDQQLAVSYYVTDPLAVNRAIPGSGQPADEGGTGGTAGTGAGGTAGEGGRGTGGIGGGSRGAPRDRRGGARTR
jgi:general secretion pathway protein I